MECGQESSEVAHPYAFDKNVMSLIGRPTGDEPVSPRDGRVEIRGVAWAGDDEIEGVEVSMDGGDSWHDAELFGPSSAGAWRLFRYEWNPDAGSHTLVSRASDDRGRIQPATIGTPEDGLEAVENGQYPWNEGGYGANACLPNAIEIEVTEEM